MTARISDCGRYRYTLGRDIPASLLDDVRADDAQVLFVMLNPSTADAAMDDPTIRRCIAFARRWGYGSLAVVNLYALRATDPTELERAEEPIGPDNDLWLARLATASDLVIAAWGTHAMAKARAGDVMEILERSAGADAIRCLRLTQTGHPWHPLYVPGNTDPVPFALEVAA